MTMTDTEALTVVHEAGLAGRVVHVPQRSRLENVAGQETVLQLQRSGFAGRIFYIPRHRPRDTSALANVITRLQAAGLSGTKVYVPPVHEGTHASAVQTALRHLAASRRTLYVPSQRTPQREALVQTLLERVETIYERTGSALVTAHPHRPGWAFIQALGASRLAHQLQVPREAIVDARRRAYQRWRYWVLRYEQPLWQELQARVAHRQWDGQFHRYLACRAALRRGTPDDAADPLVPFARRSLESRSWMHHRH